MLKNKRFLKLYRLRSQCEFQAVFKHRKRLSSAYFLFYYLPNSLGYARIGVVASKRNIRLAVQRNRIKRAVKECFRQDEGVPAGYDIIVLVLKQAYHTDNNELTSCLKILFSKLREQEGD